MTANSACQRQHDARVNGITKTDTPAAIHGPTPRALPDICFELRAKIDAFLEEQPDDGVLRNVQRQVRVSMDVIQESLRRYGADHLSLSYNGGKDCLVLLILILACLPSCAPPSSPSPDNPPPPTIVSPRRPLQAIYIVSSDPFSEVEDFVAASAEQYHLDLKRYALPMRPALEAYLEDTPIIKAIFLGTRRTDPHGEFLTHFDPTDQGWPQFMRVHPVIDWHYVEIWAFIRHLQIPFCELYNRGFTSLGGVTDTRPNPALALGGDTSKFHPAYELRDDDEERLGRD
ncbi:uncharacterized protein B0H64DRAFT_168112 [Chaetomium fimeti]|uniref:FAD synthase n=1 Tax=Chaetomium fimeti TaxID=1854472 RepID=A0AAE0HGY4_9PEZI|nr:hypothetical protein B0H64DRAFT_168112 [Chaetomium fimeti]